MKLKCAIIDDYQHVAKGFANWSIIEDQVEVRFYSSTMTGPELVKEVADSQIIVIMRERTPFRRALLEQLPNLKLLITSGPRNSAIDLESAKNLGIKVVGTKAYKQPPTELTWALILGLARNLTLENYNFKNAGPWQSSMGICLSGKTIGILGLGHIGQRVAKIAQAFDMHVISWSQNLTEDKASQFGVEFCESKEELLRISDFVTLHLVPGTKYLQTIGKNELSLMKSSAFLINTSRSSLVDQAALLEALEKNIIAGAGLDVFDEEPVPLDSKFRQLSNVLCTPHLGYVADLNYSEYFSRAVENIQNYLEDKPMLFELN